MQTLSSSGISIHPVPNDSHSPIMPQDMETFAARLASFDLVLHPEKRRSSSAKTAKPITWPHHRPSPAELAHAGFFYNPYETNPDNTTCFLCRRALDGWEEEDNPITEHLKHAKDCGWAIMMNIQQHSSNPAEIEDPTSDEIREARMATFGTQWPHDDKEDWVCNSQKMVDGGWYFCPTEESNDLASCAYCKLSLDGWEPQDNPFDEHYRRSSDCSFFVFAQPPGKKGKGKKPRSKKARTSKATRLSTQSTASEAPVSDLDDIMDQSIMSQTSTKPKSAKKTTKSKAKNSKSKKEDPVETANQMDLDELENPVAEAAKPKRATRGKKRTSEDVEHEESAFQDSVVTGKPGRPSKKRATNSRSSVQQDNDQYYEVMEETQDDQKVEEELSKTDDPPKKSGRGRKPSSASTTKMTTNAHVAQETELYSTLQTNSQNQPEVLTESKPDTKKKQAPAKSKSKKKQKVNPEPAEALDRDLEHKMPVDDSAEVPLSSAADVEEPVVQKAPQAVERGHARASSNPGVDHNPHEVERQVDSDLHQAEVIKSGGRQSPSHVETQRQEPDQDIEEEPIEKATKKTSKKKASTERTKGSKKTEKASQEPDIPGELPAHHGEPESQSTGQEGLEKDQNMSEQGVPEPVQEQTAEPSSTRRRSSKVPPKTAQRYSDLPQEKLYARSLAGTRSSDAHSTSGNNDLSSKYAEHRAVSPLPSDPKSTPSLSPQSSDAENHPPSMRPTPQPPLESPAMQPARIPLAPSTPSPSKRNANMGGINSNNPWKSIDIDQLIFAHPSDPENIDFNSVLQHAKGDLTSPERRMSVEEWIRWNAKNGEEKLKRECERLVCHFESEGARAMRVLEGIECID